MGDINPYRIKISQLRALTAIAEYGSFSDAAMHLDLSQSAVSHAIATLEQELGVVLLSRNRHGAVLTPLGRQVTKEANRILTSLDTIGRQAQQARGLQRGQVRLAGFRSVATHILPEAIHQFRGLYPHLTVTINEFHHYHQVETEVRQGRADIGFTYLPTSADFNVWELLRDRYIVLLPPADHNGIPPLTWEALMEYPLILGPAGDGCRELIERHFAAAGYAITPAYEVREDSTIISLVQRGLGATVMARLAAEPIPPQLTVAELPVPLERVIGVIQVADSLQPPAVYAFMEALMQVWQQSEFAPQPLPSG